MAKFVAHNSLLDMTNDSSTSLAKGMHGAFVLSFLLDNLSSYIIYLCRDFLQYKYQY